MTPDTQVLNFIRERQAVDGPRVSLTAVILHFAYEPFSVVEVIGRLVQAGLVIRDDAGWVVSVAS